MVKEIQNINNRKSLGLCFPLSCEASLALIPAMAILACNGDKVALLSLLHNCVCVGGVIGVCGISTLVYQLSA